MGINIIGRGFGRHCSGIRVNGNEDVRGYVESPARIIGDESPKYINLNPDPANFKIEQITETANYTVAEIRYPDCKNYEGLKVLVYEGRVRDALLAAKTIDPHFEHPMFNQNGLAPVARFEPTDRGRALAMMIARASVPGGTPDEG